VRVLPANLVRSLLPTPVSSLPPRSCFGLSLLQACVAARDATRAFEVYAKMQLRGVAPSLSTYHYLAAAAEESGQWKRAIAVMVDMRVAGYTPGTVEYNALIASCINNDPPLQTKAYDVYRGMRKAGIRFIRLYVWWGGGARGSGWQARALARVDKRVRI
jgi:pentatricopeptide repeat protein